jgi:hypothetical protein
LRLLKVNMSYSVSAASRILGIARPTVEQRVAEGTLEREPGHGKILITHDSIVAHLEGLILEATDRLLFLHTSRSQVEEAPLPAERARDRLVLELVDRALDISLKHAQEQEHRTAAEVRVDELEQALNRANRAIEALKAPAD